MKNYYIEFSWMYSGQQSLIVVTNKQNEELIQLCDYLFENFIHTCTELKIYFFKNKDNASHYIFMRMLKDIDEEKALKNSYCSAYLIANTLTACVNRNECLKSYEQPGIVTQLSTG